MVDCTGGAENAGLENAGVDRTDGKCRSGKYRSNNVWKAVKQKIKFSTFLIKSRSTGRPLVSSTTELTGLVPDHYPDRRPMHFIIKVASSIL